MNVEKRTIKASLYAGLTEITLGFALYLLGWGDWYYNHFHFFGMLGFGMVAYAFWHNYFLIKETGSGASGKKYNRDK